MKSHDFVSDFFSSAASQLRSHGDFQMVAKLGWWPQAGFACMSPALSSCIELSWSPFPFHVATWPLHQSLQQVVGLYMMVQGSKSST